MKLAFLFAAFACACIASPLRTNLLVFNNSVSEQRPIRTTNDWNIRRASILHAMQTVMGSFPDETKRVALDVRVEEETDCGHFVRRKISYVSEPGSRVPAYLLIPKAALNGTNKARAILTLHQTRALGNKVVVGLGGSADDEYGVELAKRGYVCLAPAYPLLADYQPDWRKLGYASGTMKAIWDNVRGLDLLESLPYTKRGSFAAIGHSLGGHNSIYTAAFDERIKVIVSSCGFDSYRDYKDGNITGWTSDRYMPRLKNHSLDALPFDFHEIIGALAPRAVFVNAPIGDTNFKWRSVDAVAASAHTIFQLYGATNNLRIEHPNCGHEFPKAMREAAYAVIDKELK
ncbi:MAG TPA: prolyl oligopeptidase family serine peptidase [Candidatus Acidoferrum sp.]|nr:prolyl oligopeptidase family serine peptidase [Candidatus Acidoferrum sp.]